MGNRRIFIPLMGIILAGTFTYAHAQWPNYPDSRIPRTKDGKPNLTAPAPRLNGKLDISGVWQAERSPESEYDSVLGQGFTALQPDTHERIVEIRGLCDLDAEGPLAGMSYKSALCCSATTL